MQSEVTKNLFAAKLAAQKAIGVVKKDKINPQTKSKYASWDSILAMLIPCLNDAGIVMTVIPTLNNENICVSVRLDHPASGEWVVFDGYEISKDANNKNTRANQVQNEAGVLTYAKRYAVSAIFNIATDEDTDGASVTQRQSSLADKKSEYASLLAQICKNKKLERDQANNLILERAGNISNLDNYSKYTKICIVAQNILKEK